MQPAYISFLHGLDVTSPFFFSPISAAYQQHRDSHPCMYIYPRISNATIWSTRCQCLLRSSGGGCAAVVAAAQLLQPGDSKKYHDARAGLLVVHWGQQGWAGWGGRA